MEEKLWIYKSTAKTRYKLTDNQIRQAVANSLIEAKIVRNPHYRNAPQSLLLKLADVEKNLQQIKAFPKLAEPEKAKRKVYAKKKQARDKLEFYCPKCQRNIRALRGSRMFEAYFNGEVPLEEAKKVLMIAHYRHAHTNYEAELYCLYTDRRSHYQELRDEGYDFDTAWMIVDDEFAEEQGQEKEESEVEDLRAKCNAEAVELLKKDGLLS
jgi:hypothetical protein